MTCLLFARLNLFVMFVQLSAGNLDEFLNYYETLHHDDLRHQIKRRDLYTKNPTERIVEFDAHGKHFKLVLHKNTSVLSPDFKVSVVGSREKRSAEIIDTTIYKGYVDDEPTTSSVSAYWDDDQHFTATISTESETFVVEPSWRHLPDSPDYTLISYKGSDMKQNNEKSTNPFCGAASHAMGHGKTSDAKETLDGTPNMLNKDRTKRDANTPCPKSAKKTCQVLLVADHRFHQLIGDRDVAKTTKYMILILDRVNDLFRSQEFGNCGKGFGVAIKDIVVYDEPSRPENHYNSNRTSISSEDLLRRFSTYSRGEKNYSKFCLVHLFTAASFKSGVLGIASLAGPTAEPTGGLCSGRDGFGLSENTGWTTFKDRDGNRVLSLQAFLVVAHEFGHGWGSIHEFPNSTSCNPQKGGKYLMYVYSVNGREKNNRLFSQCSREAIRNVLVHKAKICFEETDKSGPFCGNYDVEGNEECDEGLVSKTACCDSTCHLRPGNKCSDVNHPCCENCSIAIAGRPCRDPDVGSCSQLPNCDGNSWHCPKPDAKLDGERCEEQGVCINQTCKSICEYNNKTLCSCDSVELSCRICCRDTPSENDRCKVYRVNDTMDYINVSDNTPCPMGLCSNGVCTKVTDASLKRSWRFIEIISFSQFVVFMKNNIVGTVIVLSLLFWIPASCTVSYIDRKRAKESKESKKDMKFISSVLATNLLVSQNEQNSVKIKRATETLDRKTTIRARPA